ncbi:MAG: PfkB family carbohydrate kinase [Roseburia sp.]
MVLKNLGCENTALGFMAGVTGREIIRLLEEKGISTDFIHVAEGTSRINVKLRAQKETEINGQGPAIASADIKKLYEKLDSLQDGDILVLAGSIPDTMPESMCMDIAEHLQNMKSGRSLVDASKWDLLRMNGLAYHPFYRSRLCQSRTLLKLFHRDHYGIDDIVRYAQKLHGKRCTKRTLFPWLEMVLCL